MRPKLCCPNNLEQKRSTRSRFSVQLAELIGVLFGHLLQSSPSPSQCHPKGAGH